MISTVDVMYIARGPGREEGSIRLLKGNSGNRKLPLGLVANPSAR